MQITCYSGFSKKPNSTKQPSGGTVKNVTLKQPTSVLNPVFVIEDYALDCNYIKWGVRYYFVDDIVIVHNNIAEFHCSTDVLATYKTDIVGSSQYVVRAAGDYDGLIADHKYPTKNGPSFNSYPFSGDLSTKINTTGTYIIGLKNGEGNTGLTFYAVNSANMRTLVAYMFAGSWLDAGDISVSLQKLLINPMDYISCCYWFPITLTFSSPSDHIYFGFWDSGANGNVIPESDRVQILYDTVTIGEHPQSAARGKFLNGSPFTNVTASIFGFGRIPLDANLLINSQTIGAYIRIDLFTGIAELSIASGGGDLSKTSTMFGVPIQLSQVTQDIIKPIVTAIDASAKFAVGDYIGAGVGVVDSVMQTMMPKIQTTGSIGSKVAFQETPHIFVEWYKVADEDITQFGRPLCKMKTLSNLSGFIQCENADLNTSASPGEKDRIINYLNGGFYNE